MKPGDLVIYVPDPLLFGVGMLESVRVDGHLVVRWADGSSELYSAHELELESVWRESAVA